MIPYVIGFLLSAAIGWWRGYDRGYSRGWDAGWAHGARAHTTTRTGVIHATHWVPTVEECERHGDGWCTECQPDKMPVCLHCRLKAPYLNRPCARSAKP